MDKVTEQQPKKHEKSVDDEYISQMSPFEISVYRIAKSHLGTSFNLKKINWYLKWIGKK